MSVDLLSLLDTYPSDDVCRELLEDLRWPDGVACPVCGSKRVGDLRTRARYTCADCRHQFSVTAGTIMHDSHLPLRKWFIAIYLMCESKKGISALQIKRTIGVAYQTAWHLCHRIRSAMGNEPMDGPTLLGVVEVDETLIGGKRTGRGRGYRGNKVWVAGAIQRDGDVRLEQVPDTRRATLHDFIARTVKDEAEAIYTDDLASYLGIADHDTRHATVNHSMEQWVLGDVHTNSIESIWALFTRSIMGAFHHVSPKYLDRYLEELEWRFSNRKNQYIFMDTLRRIVRTEPLTYAALTGKAA